MSTAVASPVVVKRSAPDRIGLLVLGSIAGGLALGLLLVLAVAAGGPESRITGAALVALGAGFLVLGRASGRVADQPQRWALPPGAAALAAGLALLLLAPSARVLGGAGWLWPPALLALVVWSFRGARQALRSEAGRAVLYTSLAGLALVATGGAFETVAEAASENSPPTGRTYLVAGRPLYLNCVGAGSPTVVLFNGLGERTPSWAWVQQEVARVTRVCSFDRPGEGWSGGSAVAANGHQLASDMHGLLRAAHVPGPYVLAGHSTGGTYALVYAKDYPQQVAGVALLDSATPYQFDLPDYPAFYAMWKRAGAVLPSAARTGLGRLLLRGGFDTLPPSARRAARAFAASPRELAADHVEFLQLPTVFDEAKALKSLRGEPLAVVTAPEGAQRGWIAAQRKLAQLSTNSIRRTVVGATHASLLEDKGYAWIASSAVTEVVRAARTHRALR